MTSFVFKTAHSTLLALARELAHTLGLTIVVLLSVSISDAVAQQKLNSVNNVRLWHSPDKTRVVFDMSADIEHRVFRLENPSRIVVDIQNADLAISIPSLDSTNKHIQTLRHGQPKNGVLRFVLELKTSLQQHSFVLTPNELYGYRLVLDLVDPSAKSENSQDTTVATQQQSLINDEVSTSDDSDSELNAAREPISVKPPVARKFVVAIDAGHGGEDPGAIGHRGSREKKITLEIANRLKAVINADPRMQAELIRSGDYYIKLDKRRTMARARNADIFVSIHADAFRKSSASGLSVFALSQRGATSTMAKALADKENASDLIGGVSLANKDEVLRQVLVDLSMTNTISESVNLGGRVLKELSKLGKLHSKRVEQAGFAVLKSPDMPSILIETGFITNPEEERKLRTSSYQAKLARAIHTAIGHYFEQTPHYSNAVYSSPTYTSKRDGRTAPASSKPRYHKVVRGDSLSKIAQKYGSSVRALKQLNDLKRDTVMLGQRLLVSKSQSSAVQSTAPGSIHSVVHTVRRGDSLSKISAQYNVTIKAIKRVNGLRSNTLVLGQKLKLPGVASKLTRKPILHKVKRGDTLSEIAEKYGSSVNKIMRANKLRNQTVMLGQTLKIPG